MEGLENDLWCRWSEGKVGEWAELIVIVIAELILQLFRHFTYVTTHSPTLPSPYLRHSSFSNPSVASPMSQFILQPFFLFSYVTNSSLNSPGELPMPFKFFLEPSVYFCDFDFCMSFSLFHVHVSVCHIWSHSCIMQTVYWRIWCMACLKVNTFFYIFLFFLNIHTLLHLPFSCNEAQFMDSIFNPVKKSFLFCIIEK